MTPRDCGDHAEAPDELRTVAVQLLERLRTAVEPLAPSPLNQDGHGGEEGDERGPGAGACTSCPVCAVRAILRGERSELAASLAEHAGGLLTTLIDALRETGRSAPQGGEHHHQRPRPGGGRSVQRIMVHRT